MKVSKILVPVVALTTMQNNQAAAMQAGKEINIIYEGSVNVGGYVVPVQQPADFGCEHILQKLAECWQLPDPAAAAACSVFWGGMAALWGCV